MQRQLVLEFRCQSAAGGVLIPKFSAAGSTWQSGQCTDLNHIFVDGGRFYDA
jgi:hypothetical protein